MKTLILLCPATFEKMRRQRFPNYPYLTNLMLVAEIAGHKRLETTEWKEGRNRGNAAFLRIGGGFIRGRLRVQ